LSNKAYLDFDRRKNVIENAYLRAEDREKKGRKVPFFSGAIVDSKGLYKM